MRLVSYLKDGQADTGVMSGPDSVIDVTDLMPDWPNDIVEILQLGPSALLDLKKALTGRKGVAATPLKNLDLLPLVPNPPKIICIGLNYADHAKEGGRDRPDHPSFFMRGATSQVAHGKPIIRPKCSAKLDYEAEIAVIIGSSAKHLTRENALSCVAGYSLYNDGSIRDYQRRGTQWTLGKNFDATGGFGPWLITPDELPAGCEGLRIQSRLNGNIMQDANTKDFLWNIVESLVIITECMTLEPGDVIITGTPAGVGYARTPPVFMAPGDVIEIEVDGMGVLMNTIVDEK